jgi:hypothetical protein
MKVLLDTNVALDADGFAASSIPVVSPEQFLDMITVD